MKHLFASSWVLVCLGLLLTGCNVSSAQDRPATAKQDEAPDPVNPELVASVNGLADSVVKAGEPLLIEVAVALDSGRNRKNSLTISSPSGGWGAALRVEILDSARKDVPNLTVKPAIETTSSITIEPRKMGRMVWVIESTQALSPGEYSLSVILDTSKSSSAGWKGTERSPECKLTVKSATAPLAGEEQTLSVLNRVRVHTWMGRDAEALSICDEYLESHPEDEFVLVERADLLAKSGKYEEAIAAYDLAISKVPPTSEGATSEPPHLLLHKRRMAELALHKG